VPHLLGALLFHLVHCERDEWLGRRTNGRERASERKREKKKGEREKVKAVPAAGSTRAAPLSDIDRRSNWAGTPARLAGHAADIVWIPGVGHAMHADDGDRGATATFAEIDRFIQRCTAL